MITVQKALEILSENLQDFGTIKITLNQAHGRILAETLSADRDFPPYDRITMDGIAISFDSYKNGSRSWNIQEVAAAGSTQKKLTAAVDCIECMTGAIMPQNTDSVIRYEDLVIENNVASLISIAVVKEKQNVHFQGIDRKTGDIIVNPGIAISPAELGVAATIGKHEILVKNLPKVMIISTGDELVDIDQNPLPHQIRKSNISRIQSSLLPFGIHAETDHLLDDQEVIKVKLESYLNKFDIIILSGGVSKGKFDFIPGVMESIGVKKLFHKIKQRPGKPFWFGKTSECTIFAFPGNPVSSFLCMQKYFMHWMRLSLGNKHFSTSYGMLSEDVQFQPELEYFLEVKLSANENAQIVATPFKGNGSGDLANLVKADAFIQLPIDKSHFKKGEVYPLLHYR